MVDSKRYLNIHDFQRVTKNFDQNSSSYVSCGVIRLDRWCVSKVVSDWIRPTGGKFSTVHWGTASDKSLSRTGPPPEPETRSEGLLRKSVAIRIDNFDASLVRIGCYGYEIWHHN